MTDPAPQPAAQAPERSQRLPIIVLAVVSSLLIAGVLALLIHFVVRGNPAPTGLQVAGSTTPSPSPTAPVVEDAPEDATGARFSFFSAQTEVQCTPGGNAEPVRFSWESDNALEVWFATGDEDTLDGDFVQVPLSGTQDDLTAPPFFPCGQIEYQDYTMRLVGPEGAQATETFRVIDLNWNRG